jgi:hypothetical protein
MNPPEGLHPFLQWWLYKSHVTKEMLEAYQDFSQKRDDLLKRAREDGGRKLRVVLGNKVWPKGFVPPDTDTWELGDVFLVQINNASDSPINAEM